MAQLVVEIGHNGPNRAHSQAAEETRDVSSRDQFNPDNSGFSGSNESPNQLEHDAHEKNAPLWPNLLWKLGIMVQIGPTAKPLRKHAM